MGKKTFHSTLKQRHHHTEEGHKSTQAISSFITKGQTEAENVKYIKNIRNEVLFSFMGIGCK